MDWWQIVLIILASIIGGLLIGGLLTYLTARLLKRPLLEMPFLKKRETTTVVEEPLKSTAPDLLAELIKKREMMGQQAKEQSKREAEAAKKVREAEKQQRKEAEVAEAPLKSTAPDLVAEVENNRQIATQPWTGKLLPFATGVWDASRDGVPALPVNLGEDLTQAYVDMRLANSIVWLATELGRRSQNLDDNYTKLCTNIATRLDKILPLLKQSGN